MPPSAPSVAARLPPASTRPGPAHPLPAMSWLELVAPRRRTLVDIVTRLPGLGVGQRVTRAPWLPFAHESFYEITKVRAKKDGASARVWGVKVFKGVPAAAAAQLRQGGKEQWHWALEPARRDGYRALAARLSALDRSAAAAAAGAAAAAAGSGAGRAAAPAAAADGGDTAQGGAGNGPAAK